MMDRQVAWLGTDGHRGRLSVCNYCGCRALEPIAQLTAEHERILRLSGEIRRAVARGEHEAADRLLHTLHDLLEVHDAVEELALYPAMARHLEFGDKVAALYDEHDELDRVIQAALSKADHSGPGTQNWASILTALEVLTEHIDREEHGLFPAAAVSLDPADWEHAAAVRAQRPTR